MCIACCCCPSLFFSSCHLFSLSILSHFPFYREAFPFSFSNFARNSLPFFQRALCSFAESSKGLERQEDKPPRMAEVVTQAQKEALPQGVGTCSLPFPFSPFFFFLSSPPLAITLSALSGVDTGTKEFGLAIAKEAQGTIPNV